MFNIVSFRCIKNWLMPCCDKHILFECNILYHEYVNKTSLNNADRRCSAHASPSQEFTHHKALARYYIPLNHTFNVFSSRLTIIINPFIPKSGQIENKISKISRNRQHHMKVLLNSYHLNGHILGFHPQT